MLNTALIDRFPWYIPAAIATWREGSGAMEPLARLYIENRPMVTSQLLSVDTTMLRCSAIDDVIDTFLSYDNLKIVAQEGDIEGNEVCVDAEFEDIDDLVTEELAEIYLNQGFHDEAIAIYTKLSLLNSEKSVYFAKLISDIHQIDQKGL